MEREYQNAEKKYSISYRIMLTAIFLRLFLYPEKYLKKQIVAAAAMRCIIK